MKKKRPHKLSDKLPVLAAFIFCIIGVLGTQLVSWVLSRVLHFAMPFVSADTNPIAVLGVGVLALFLYKLWYKPEYTGAVVYSEYRKVWVVVAAYAVFFIYEIICLVMEHETYRLTVNGFCTALYAGVLEETVYRGFMIPVMMRKKRNIAAALFVSSGVFGLVHGTNIFVGADPLHTLIQVVTSFMLGIVLGGMFLFSGNIIVPIAIHTIQDILAIGVQSAVTEEGVVTTSVTVQTLIEDAALVLLFAFVIYFIFKRKNKEAIHSVWDKKWKADSDNADAGGQQ